ncbi:MAG TPA: PHP domain-containing protein [Spirochaetales bacterium]|nr:PHP domain-containing protein [Spirochaetales bacterium]HRY54642.1 PHP domain-containing protein [Spirochaetia bacterium]
MNNYHTHSYRCRHASGDIADYVEAARAAGIGELGFSEHVPYADGRWPDSRMDLGELPGYLAAVRAAAEAESRRPEGEGRMSILLGLESEWSAEDDAYLREELVGRLGVGYLVSGTHYYRRGGAWEDAGALRRAADLSAYAAHLARSLESGLFAYVAHPDLYCMSYLRWDEDARACARDVLDAARAARIPVEINGYGMRKARVRAPEGERAPYPHEGFWELAASYGLDVVVNSDAHRPVDVAAGLAEGRALAARLGLRVLDSPFER